SLASSVLALDSQAHKISMPHPVTAGSSHMPRKKSRVNKMDLIREALGTLGKNAMPLDIQKSVKDKHGVELSTSLISNYKSYLHAKGKKKAGRKPGSKPTAVAANGSRSTGISMADIQAVKSLVDSMGAEKVVGLAKVLGK